MRDEDRDEDRTGPHDDRSVPGIGGPGSGETAPDGRSALRLHTGMSAIAAALSAFVTVLFVVMFDEIVLAIVFAVVTLGCVGWGGWTALRLMRTGGLRN